jgi:hypothetical protein
VTLTQLQDAREIISSLFISHKISKSAYQQAFRAINDQIDEVISRH